MYTNKSYITKKPDFNTVDLPDAPNDTVSDIAFNAENTHCAVSSWDGTVKLYRLPVYQSFASSQNFSIEKSLSLGKPVLCVAFFSQNVVAGLADGTLALIDYNGNISNIQAHGAAIKALKSFNNQFIVSGSFDSTLKFWDLKSPTPLHTINLPGKIYSMDLKGSFLCVALSDRSIHTYDLNDINQQQTIPTRFNYAIRSVGCSSDMDSFAAGGIEAKVETFSKNFPARKIMFRCHRVGTKLYSINVLRFLPSDSNVVITGGSDGTLVWFDRVNRSKISSGEYEAPITAGEFSMDGKYFVFAYGDDWSKGYTGVSMKPALKMVLVSSIQGLGK